MAQSSKKKTLLRVVLFAAALVIAIGAFAAGVNGLLHRESGFYDVDYSPAAAPVVYQSGVRLRYYAAGTSSRIRAELNAVQGEYSDALLSLFRLLDAETVYDGVVNLASLNSSPGQWMEIGPDLEAVLRDALTRQQTLEGYSVFLGPLKKAWQDLTYLEEPLEKDPLSDPEEAEVLERLRAFVTAPDRFTLEVESGRARLTVSPEWEAFAAENGLTGPVLDLTALRDAYLLDALQKRLAGRGYTHGFLYTDSGLCVSLEEGSETAFGLLAWFQGEVLPAGDVVLPSPAAFCQLTAFAPAGQKYGYYALERPEGPLFRHPWSFLEADASRPGPVLSMALAGRETGLTDLCCQALRLFLSPDETALAASLSALPEDLFVSYALSRDPAALRLREGAGRFAPAADSPLRVSP